MEKKIKHTRSLGPRIALIVTAPLSLILISLCVYMLVSMTQLWTAQRLNEINVQTEAGLRVTESYFDPLATSAKFVGGLDLTKTVFLDGVEQGTSMRYEDDANAQELLNLIKTQHEALGQHVQAIWICGMGNKEMMTSTDWYSDPGLEPTERPWYAELISSSNEVAVSSAYVDMECNEVVVSVMYPVKNNGSIIGVVGVDVFLSGLVEAMDQVKIGKTGAVVVCDSVGSVVYSVNRADMMASVYNHEYAEEMSKALKADYSTPASAKYVEGENAYYASVAYSEKLGWRVIGTIPNEEFHEDARGLGLAMASAMLFSIALTAALGLLIGRSLAKPAKELSDALAQMATGDFRIELSGRYSCEFGSLKDSMLTVRDALSKMVMDIGQSAQSVDLGTVQIADAAQALAQGTTEQASSVEELSSTVMELAGNSNDGVKIANRLKERFEEVNDGLTHGEESMRELDNAMSDISEKSEEIEKIIKTIEDIAFQTNILALNAAVEAARAGQAGKGFSVVADEVRSLASKCDVAAKDIAVLIRDSSAAVALGKQLTGDTADRLSKVAETVHSASAIMADLASRYGEEALSLQEVSAGIEQISMVVQNNSATAEQTAASCGELSIQAQALHTLTGTFKI